MPTPKSKQDNSDSEEEFEEDWENWLSVNVTEWDFDSVPDEDLVPCCIWEYARESTTIALAAADHWNTVRDIYFRKKYEEDAALKAEHDKRAEINQQRIDSANFVYEDFSFRFWKTDCPLIGIFDAVVEFAEDGVLPWQSLPESFREHLQAKMSEKSILQPFRPANVGELEKLWESSSAELNEIRSTPDYEESDSEMFELLSETPAIDYSSNEDEKRDTVVAAFTFDFSRFSDSEVFDCFRQWVSENRPKRYSTPRSNFPTAKRKGKKEIEYRVALDRLGLMRLLHFHSPADIKQNIPEAWQRFSAKKDSFRREVRAACAFFQNLFPFLPSDELPVSHERFSTWNTPLQKYLDALDEEYFGSGGKKT